MNKNDIIYEKFKDFYYLLWFCFIETGSKHFNIGVIYRINILGAESPYEWFACLWSQSPNIIVKLCTLSFIFTQ